MRSIGHPDQHDITHPHPLGPRPDRDDPMVLAARTANARHTAGRVVREYRATMAQEAADPFQDIFRRLEAIEAAIYQVHQTSTATAA